MSDDRVLGTDWSAPRRPSLDDLVFNLAYATARAEKAEVINDRVRALLDEWPVSIPGPYLRVALDGPGGFCSCIDRPAPDCGIAAHRRAALGGPDE